jgi:hypothetical protein
LRLVLETKHKVLRLERAKAGRWLSGAFSLRVCDFFDFAQIAALKTSDLRAKKSSIFKKVTNLQDDTILSSLHS